MRGDVLALEEGDVLCQQSHHPLAVTVSRVDMQIAALSEVGFIARPFDLLLAEPVGFVRTRRELLPNGEGDFQCQRRHELHQHLADCPVEVFRLHFLERHEHVLLVGPVGVGKSFLASALGRAGYSVLFVRADTMLKHLAAARADYTFDRELRRFVAPDVLAIDDFGLHKLTAQQYTDMYDVIIGRHRHSRLIITSNRDVAEWVALFDDPILANSALDRLAHNSYQLVIEGESYRKRTSPHARRLAQ